MQLEEVEGRIKTLEDGVMMIYSLIELEEELMKAEEEYEEQLEQKFSEAEEKIEAMLTQFSILKKDMEDVKAKLIFPYYQHHTVNPYLPPYYVYYGSTHTPIGVPNTSENFNIT